MESLFSVLAGSGPNPEPVCVVTLSGPPRGKGRPRFRQVQPRGHPGFVMVYTDAETKAYEEALKWRGKAAMKGKPPIEGPLAVRVFAMMPVPKSWPNKRRDAALAGSLYPMTKPDGDNIAKIILDGLNGVIWVDDTQVVRHLVIKEYGENPGLIIETYCLP